MRILLIAHACQMRAEGQQRAQCLGALPGVDLRVIVPERWMEYGTWRSPQTPIYQTYTTVIEKVRWPWMGPAQWYLHHYPKLRKVLRSFRPDVIDIWEEPWGLVSAQTVWLRNRFLPSAKVVIETEANINRHHPFPFTSLRRYVLRHANFAVTRQTEGISVLRAHGYRGPARFVGNGVDAQLFAPRDRAACKRALGLGGFIVGYVGRLIEAKGLMDAVEALPQCPSSVNLLFVGGGVFQPTLEQRVAELGLTARVKFLPTRAMAELPEVMNAIDALLLVSRTTRTWKEQFGRVIVEAQACGTPVIGSNSGSIPEIVGEGGLIVPEGNFTALANAIRQLHEDPELAARLGQHGREQVETHYTWQRIAEQMYDVYAGLLGTASCQQVQGRHRTKLCSAAGLTT